MVRWTLTQWVIGTNCCAPFLLPHSKAKLGTAHLLCCQLPSPYTYALCAPSPLVINLPILGLRYINAAVLDPSHLNDTNRASFGLTNGQHLRLEGQAPVGEGVRRCAASIPPLQMSKDDATKS